MKKSLVWCFVVAMGVTAESSLASSAAEPVAHPIAAQDAAPQGQATAEEPTTPQPTIVRSGPKPALAVAPFDAEQAKRHQQTWATHLGVPVELTNSIGMKLVLIPPGEFMMGSPESEADRDDASFRSIPRPRRNNFMDGWGDFAPPVDIEQDFEYQHRVRITKTFYLGIYEVTQSEYEQVMGTNPSWFSKNGKGEGTIAGLDASRFPVEMVSWEDAVDFCRKLTFLESERVEGRAYRLPTEAEWEYACRAGTESAFYTGSTMDEQDENCDGEFPDPGRGLGRTTTVGSLRANAFGLYDILGNVCEWCQDRYDDDYYKTSPLEDPQGPATSTYRVLRAASWSVQLRYCRSAYRCGREPSLRTLNVGFRVVTVLPAQVSSE